MGSVTGEDSSRSSALPAYLTRFVGRAGDLTGLQRRVRLGVGRPPEERLIVVVGPGGSGKTRLTVEVATRLCDEAGFHDRFADGVWWVDLAPIRVPESLPTVVARAAGLPERVNVVEALQGLIRALQHRSALVLIDNCEHVAEACRLLCSQLLAACPGLVVLATTRTPLHAGVEIALEPLDTDGPSSGSHRSEAAELFYDRAGMLLPGYPAIAQDERAVATLCRRIGGLPLAIELAAPWMRTLSATDLLARLNQNLDLLASDEGALADRHRVMRAVLESTYSLLSDQEQQVLRGLGTFVGGFGLDAAEAVTAASLSVLSTLTERALIRRVPEIHDDTWFVMHEMIRQYAVSLLDQQPRADADEMRRRHLEHLICCTDSWEAARNGADENRWLARMNRDATNVEAALKWAMDSRSGESFLRLVAGMKNVWVYAGSIARHRQVIEAALRQPWNESSAVATVARTHVLDLAAGIELEADRIEAARQCLVERLALNRRLGDTEQEAASLRDLCSIAVQSGDLSAADQLARQSLDLCRRAEDGIGSAWSIGSLAEVAFARSDKQTAERHLLEAAAEFRRLGVGFGESSSLSAIADSRRSQGRLTDALDMFGHALAVIRRTEVTSDVRNVVRGVGAIAARIGAPETAAQLFGVSDAWEQTFGGWNSVISRPPETERAATRATLGELQWSAAYEVGMRLTPMQALEFVAQTIEHLQGTVGAPLPAGLTTREAEVVALLAEGLNNDDIASRLVLSPRTVHAHLRSIYRKLEVSTRTAAVHEAGRLGMRL